MTDSHSTEGSVALEEPRLGTLILIGGNEDCLTTKNVLREVAEAAGGADGILVVITTASNEPEDRMVVYRKAFEDLGVGTIHIINPDKRVDGSDPRYLEMIASATGVMFTGGDQLRITSLLGGTPLIAMIQMRYREEGLLVAGTSAGASALSRVMIYEGVGETGLEKNSVHTTSGIGLLQHVVVDTHFIRRGRIARQMQVLATNPHLQSIGLGEDTAVRVTDGHVLEVIGSGIVIVIDAQHASGSNIAKISTGDAIAIHNLTIHALIHGERYDITSRSFLPSASEE